MEYLGSVSKQFPPLHQNCYYHVFNRGNNREPIFFELRNYHYFIKQLRKYLSSYVDIFAYCLLQNHFHLLIRVKNFDQLEPAQRTLLCGGKTLAEPEEIISEQFRRLFLSYSKSIKKQEGRTGSLFEKNFRRKIVETTSYRLALVNYIHRNAETHRVCKDFKHYPFCSYRNICNGKSFIDTRELFSWFGTRDAFINYHIENPLVKTTTDVIKTEY